LYRYSRSVRLLAAATITTVSFGLFSVASKPASASGPDDILSGLSLDSPVRDLVTSTRTLDDDDQRSSGSFTIHGRLIDEAGAVLADKDVQVDLFPGPNLLERTTTTGQPVFNIPVGHGITGADGSFALSAPALHNISDYVDQDGQVRLLISSVDATHSAFYDLSAKLSRTPGAQPIVPTPDDHVVGAANAEDAPPPVDPEGEVEEGTGPKALEDVLLTANTASPDVPTGVTAGSGGKAHKLSNPDPAKLCLESVGIHVFGWKMQTTGMSVMTPVQIARTLGRSNAAYDWDDVRTIEVTTGWDLAYKAVKSKGSFSKTLQSGLGGTAHVSANTRVFIETSVEYRWNNLYCYKPQAIPANVRVALPYRVLGGATNRSTPRADVSCHATIPHIAVSPGNSIRVSRSSTIKITTALSVGGVNLDASQTNNASNTMSYSAPGASTAHFCGNNNTVLSASVVREANS
jgi:hypothetical protein